jgi:membrane-associated phospholipid phosphatase
MALAGAAVLFALLIATWIAAFHIAAVEHADQSILEGFAGIGSRPHVSSIARRIASLCDPKPFVDLCAIPVIVALARRRLWVALAIVAILLGANLSTQLLKPLLAVHRPFPLPDNLAPPLNGSWPSGHATAAMSLALCCMLAAPSRWRPFAAALGAGFAVAVCYSFLSLEWHYPSDVLGGFLVAGIWTLLGVASVLTANAREIPGAGSAAGSASQRVSVREALGPPSLALLAALGLVALVLIARPHQVVQYARIHETFVIGAAAIAAVGLAMATGIMLAVRR